MLSCKQQQQRAVLLLHCYPSDLKRGGDALTKLIRQYPVLLVDVGHTRYHELSNDGYLLYSATRSPGQLAAAIVFVSSDQASFITGASIAVDGGVTAA